MICRLGFEDVAKWWNFIKNCVLTQPPIRVRGVPVPVWTTLLAHKLMMEGAQAWLVWDEGKDELDLIGVIVTAVEIEDIAEGLNLLVYCIGPVVVNGVSKKFTAEHIQQAVQAFSDYRDQINAANVMWYLPAVDYALLFPKPLPPDHVLFAIYAGEDHGSD